MSAQWAIDVANVSKRYAGRFRATTALEDISLRVRDREFVGIVGPSGCGKSTLLKILAGIVSITDGSASLHGRAIDGPSKDVGVVFQQAILLPWRTILENVLLPGDIAGKDRAVSTEAAKSLLEMVSLRGFEQAYPRELSGGMQQRAAIARALASDPSILLMDEPFGALDAMTREHMCLELQRIWMEKRKTVVFITHSISEAVFLADRVLVMTARPGRIVEDVPIDLERPRPLSVMNTPVFGAYTQRIREQLSSKGVID